MCVSVAAKYAPAAIKTNAVTKFVFRGCPTTIKDRKTPIKGANA